MAKGGIVKGVVRRPQQKAQANVKQMLNKSKINNKSTAAAMAAGMVYL